MDGACLCIDTGCGIEMGDCYNPFPFGTVGELEWVTCCHLPCDICTIALSNYVYYV